VEPPVARPLLRDAEHIAVSDAVFVVSEKRAGGRTKKPKGKQRGSRALFLYYPSRTVKPEGVAKIKKTAGEAENFSASFATGCGGNGWK